MTTAQRPAGPEDARARLARTAVPVPVDRRRDVARPDGPGGLEAMRGLTGRSRPPHEFFADVSRRFPGVAHTRIAREHVYVLSDPEAILEVFVTHGRDTMKGRALQTAKALLGDGLLTSEGAFHLRQRRLIQPAFHRDRLAAYAGQMVAEAESHAARWRDGEDIETVAEMSALTLAIVGRTLFGSDLTGDAHDVGDALGEVLEGFSTRLGPTASALARLPLPANRRLDEAGARLDGLVQRMIDEHRAAGDTGDLLSMLISAQEDGVAMDDRQLRDETMTLVLAGHETTAMALSWTWWCLAREPRASAALQAELDDVLAGRPPGWDDLAALAVTRATVAEAIRLYPPAWIIGRRLLADTDVGGWTLPRGSLVLASQYAMHRDPSSWASPLAYRPARWLRVDDDSGTQVFDEGAPGQPRGAWFPFGFGTRRCVGDQFAWTEATLVLATLAQHWEVRPRPGAPVAPLPAVTLRPSSGMPATLRRRRVP